MTTKVVDNTISKNPQELSSVEYVDSHENSIATVQTDVKNLTSANSLFDFNATIPRDDASVQDVEDPRSLELIFGQKHKDIDCALCPTAKCACNRAWFSAKQVENWSGMTNRTLYNRLSELEEYQRISRLKDFANVNIPTETGAVKTTLYNLNVLNQLAMVEMKNKVLNDTAKKFSDILSEVETTGSYGVTKPEMSDEEIMSRALEIAHRTLALREERIKALTAERDEAIRTRAMIGSRREATAMATASAKSKECKRLTIENEELKDAVGRGTNWCTVSMMKSEWKREFGHEPDWRQLKKFSADFPTDMQPVKDVEEKVVLHNGGEKVSKVYRYHREAWTRYRQYEETIRATDTETKNA